MEKKLYIVSFGNSRKYRMDYTIPTDADPLRKPNPFADIERQLTAYLRREAPEASDLAYFTSPKATEVRPEHAQQYSSYPPLDARAIQEIEKLLLKEVRMRLDNRLENSDAPYSDVNPSAL